MTIGIEKLKARLEKAEAAKKKAVRQSQLLTSKLGKQERRDDTRRKIIDGAHIQTEALRNPEIAALLHLRRDENLVRDDDRALYGLAILSEAEKSARGVPSLPTTRGSKAKSKGGALIATKNVVTELPDSSAPVIHQDERQSEAA